MTEYKDQVWFATVDNHAWQVEVTRTGDHRGVMVISSGDGRNEIYVEEVNLAFDALFGPDVDDVAYWQEKAIEVIDSYSGDPNE